MKKTARMIDLLLCAGVAGLLAAGCQAGRSGSTFSRKEALQPQRTFQGTVERVTAARLEGTKTPIGAIAGAALGGVAGHSVGGGSGKDIATVGGALAGAAVGAIAEEKITARDALSITVKLDDGRVLTVVQETDAVYQPGQRVQVLETEGGRMRVQPL